MPALIFRPGLRRDGDCKLRPIEGVDDAFELHEGLARAGSWSPLAVARMDPDYPKDIALSDSLAGAGVLIVSPRVRAVVEPFSGAGVEWLPVTIVNHKGRVAASDYAVLNPLVIRDCIDLDRSGVKWNTISPDDIYGCASLVLKPAAIEESLMVLRPKHWEDLVLVRRQVAAALVSAGLTGLHLVEPGDYTGIY